LALWKQKVLFYRLKYSFLVFVSENAHEAFNKVTTCAIDAVFNQELVIINNQDKKINYSLSRE